MCSYQLAPFTALPLASQRPNPHPTHTRNVNNTTSPHHYHYKISRRHSQDFPNHKPKLHARSHHRVPFTPPTRRHVPYLPGSSKNPPSTFSPLPIFTDRSLHTVFRSECRTISYLATGKPGALVLAAVWVRCTPRIRSSASSTKENTLQLRRKRFSTPVPTRNGFVSHIF